MGVIKVTKTENYAVIPNNVTHDTRISFKAKGILAYLLSKPDDWTVRMEDLVNQGPDGKAAIKTAMRELRDAGYAELKTIHVEGKARGKTWEIADRPIFRQSEKQTVRKSHHILSTDTPYKGERGKVAENVDDLDFSIRKEKELFEYFDKNPAQVEAIKDHCRWAFTDEQFQDTIKEYVLNSGNVAQLHKDPQRQMKAIYRWFQRQKRFSKPLPSKAKKTSSNTPGALLDKTLTGLMKEGYEKYLRQVKEKYPALYASNCKVLTASEFEDIFSMKKFPQYRIKGKLTLKEKLWEVHELFNDRSYHRNTKDSITPMLEDYLTDKIKINGDLQRRSA